MIISIIKKKLCLRKYYLGINLRINLLLWSILSMDGIEVKLQLSISRNLQKVKIRIGRLEKIQNHIWKKVKNIGHKVAKKVSLYAQNQ